MMAGLCLVVAMLFTGVSVFTFQKSQIFAISALPTTAEVVEILKEELLPQTNSSNTERSLATHVNVPVFQYKIDGVIFEQRADTRYLSESVSYSVGDTTTIYYNPENPSDIRAVLTPSHSSTLATIFTVFAGVTWLLFSAFLVRSLKQLRADERQPFAQSHSFSGTDTVCTLVALEATSERIQNARMIRLVCRWIHPDTGAEWLLRSVSFHPTALPTNLELGMRLPCKVNFDNPDHHEIPLLNWQSSSVVA
jgi:hypothetical protein